jgi:acyl dehydratase
MSCIDHYMALVGKEAQASNWTQVTQDRINAFADATGDHQFIHVDPVRAAATPLGGAIAHGYLTLSLIIPMSIEVMPRTDDARMGMNYGFDKVRFITPVKAGKRVRGHFAVTSVTERSSSEFLIKIAVTMEVEGERKPAMVADWLGLIYI